MKYGVWQLITTGNNEHRLRDVLRFNYPNEYFSRLVLPAGEQPYAREGQEA